MHVNVQMAREQVPGRVPLRIEALAGRAESAQKFAIRCFDQDAIDPYLRSGSEDWNLANILIVDDDPAVQMAIRLLLERAGHSVTVAGDGRKGLALFEATQFDLLFLDIFMPGMDGLETMRHIRRQQPAIPIIVISGRSIAPDAYAEPDFLKMATRLGAVASLQKPFRADALMAAVDGCLEADGSSGEPEIGIGSQ